MRSFISDTVNIYTGVFKTGGKFAERKRDIIQKSGKYFLSPHKKMFGFVSNRFPIRKDAMAVSPLSLWRGAGGEDKNAATTFLLNKNLISLQESRNHHRSCFFIFLTNPLHNISSLLALYLHDKRTNTTNQHEQHYYSLGR